MATLDDASIPPSPSAGFKDNLTHFLLIVVGEPLADDYIELVLGEVEKGLKNWNINGDEVDYNDVLTSVAEADPVKTGLVHVSFGYAGAHLGVVILINPTSEHLSQELDNLLSHPSPNKHVLFGGHSLEGTGDWVLHDDTYTLHDIAEVFSKPNVDAALLKASQDEKQTLCLSGCHWSTTAVTKQPFSKSLNLAINPQEAKHDVEGVSMLIETIRSRIVVPSPFDLMEPPTMGVGIKCKITKPTVLIFPAAKGDCAFFAVSDFSLFVGGGYSVKSCFWKFAKHLHRVDAVILPHTRPDTVIGINSLLRRKIAEKQLEAPEIDAEGYEDWQIKCNSPEVGVVYMNAPDNKQTPKSLVLKTVGQGNETTKLLQQLSIKPMTCTANVGKEIKPITLYLKVGIGKLDMYILSPTQDSKELKDFLQQWSAGKAFGKVKTGVKVNGKESEVTLPNACSICALMVWQPASPQENIVRVLFPGNAPQSKIIEGLDRVKHLEFLKFPDAVQSGSGKITAMKKKDVNAMKKAAANGSAAVNGSMNGKTSQMKETNACTDGMHCNTPPPSPTGICTDGKNCNTPPPSNICTDGEHCNTPPPSGICDDGKHCNTPPPGSVCDDGKHCNTPPPNDVCNDGKHCNTPPPGSICDDGKHCNTPPPDFICDDGEHCNTPPPEFICDDGKHCNTPPPDFVCDDGEHCNTPPPGSVCDDGKHCNTPPPDFICDDGEHCNTPPPEKDIDAADAANLNLNPKQGKFNFDDVIGGDKLDNNTCHDGVNCNTPPPEDDYEQNGMNGNLDSVAAGEEEAPFAASGDSQLPESQQGIESDVNFNPTNPALAKIDTTRLHDGDSPERLASGEITPADMVEYGMDEESDGFSSGHGTVDNTPDHPQPPSCPAPPEFATADDGRESPEIQPEQPSSGVEMEDLSSPSDQPHPWEPTIELSTDAATESSHASDDLVGSPQIQVTEPAEMTSEAIDCVESIGQQGTLDTNCELDESSEEISQASEIEVKPSLTDDVLEDIEVSDAQEELRKTESTLPEAEGDTYHTDMEPSSAETDDRYSSNNAPESEQICGNEQGTTDSVIPATEPEADQQEQSDISAPAEFAIPEDFEDEIDGINEEAVSEPIIHEISTETDLDEVIKERDQDEVAPESEGQDIIQETNLDEVESEMKYMEESTMQEEVTSETNFDEFAMGVQEEATGVTEEEQRLEQDSYDAAEVIEQQEKPEENEKVKIEQSQDVNAPPEGFGLSEQPEVDDAFPQDKSSEEVTDTIDEEQVPEQDSYDGAEFAVQAEQSEVEVIQNLDHESFEETEQTGVDDALVQVTAHVEEPTIEVIASVNEEQMPEKDSDAAAEVTRQGEYTDEDGVEVKQNIDQALSVEAGYYGQSDHTEVDNALIQESAQEIVQEAVDAAVGVVERDQMISEEPIQDDDIQHGIVPDDPEDYGTDVDAGREDIPADEELEKGDVKEEPVSVTEPTISDSLEQNVMDSLEQNATDSLEDLQNEAASDVDIPPVIEEEVSAQVEEQQESVPEEKPVLETLTASREEENSVQSHGDQEPEDVLVPEQELVVKPEPAADPLISDYLVAFEHSSPTQQTEKAAEPVISDDLVAFEQSSPSQQPEPAAEPFISDDLVAFEHSSPTQQTEKAAEPVISDDLVAFEQSSPSQQSEPPSEPLISSDIVAFDHYSPPQQAASPVTTEEQKLEESKGPDTVLTELKINQDSGTEVLESSTVQVEEQTSSTAVLLASSVSPIKSTKSSSGKRSPSPTKSTSKGIKDKDKGKKPTDRAKASDVKPKTGSKTLSTPKAAEKKASPKSTASPSVKKIADAKTSARKSLPEKKPADKLTPTSKKTPAEKKPPTKTRSQPSSSKGSDKKTPSSASTSTTDGPLKKAGGLSAKTSMPKKPSAITSTPTSRPGAKQPERPSTGGRPTSGAKKVTDSKKPSERPTRSAPPSRGDSKSNGSKKPGSASAKSAQASKAASIPASGPAIHLDLAYIPNHASADSINSEFFRRVRAKNYVISANDGARNQPAVGVLDSLLEGKMKWEDAEAEVTVIPTYDYLSLRDWELRKHEELSKAKIEISQPACRSIVQMKDENFFMYKVEL